MSSRYSSCFGFRSPNSRSSSTSEKPITAFSGVRSSWDMLARNSDLCRLATSSSWLLRASSWKSRAFWIASADWLANVSTSSTIGSGNAPGVRRRTTSAPRMRSSRTSGTASIDRQPARASCVKCASGGTSPMSATATGVRVSAARPTSVSRRPNLVARSAASSSSLVPNAARISNASASSSILEDRSSFGIRELHGVRDDRRQHLVEVEARAHCLADLAQTFQLVDGARELPRSQLELLHQVRVPDRDRTLSRERRRDLDLARRERIDFAAPERDDADHLVLAQHRHADDRAEPAEPLRLGPLVLGVGERRPPA